MKRYWRPRLAGVLLAMSVAAPVHADPTREIEVSLARLERALNSADLDALADLYAEDAVIIPSESEILDNEAAIRSFWKNQFLSGANAYRIELIDMQVHADRAYLSTLWSATVNTRDHRIVTFDGSLANVFERQADGSWKIRMQGWN